MKHLLRASLVLLSLAIVPGCASNKGDASQPPVNKLCLVSGKEVPADGPTVDYQGSKVGFCCENCVPKWNGMSDDAKKAALAKGGK